MKKIFCLFLVFALLPVFASCGAADSAQKAAGHAPSAQKSVSDLLKEAEKPSATAPVVVEEPEDTDPEKELREYLDSLNKMEPVSWDTKADVDLTGMSASLVYSEVYNMVTAAEDYKGKVVKMNGAFNVYESPARNYYTCIIKDATACCAQGVEFVPSGLSYPEDFPESGSDITVIGIFDLYEEEGTTYFQLIAAQIKAG